MRSSQARGLQAMSSSLSEMRKLSENLETTAQTTAAEAQGVIDASLAILQRVEEHSRQIAHHADQAVYFVQFGDITRQKLEHVSEALDEAAKVALGAASDADFRALAAAVERVAAIQAGQVESVRAEIQTAHVSLQSAFQGIAEETAQLAQAMQRPEKDPTAKADADEVLRALDHDLHRMEELHHQGGEVGQRARHTANEAVQASTQLARHLDKVKAFNRDMHLQALNAIVKTAALGRRDGATLEVLSMQVDLLFRESNREVEGIIATIQAVLTEARETVPKEELVLPVEPGAADLEQGLPDGFAKMTRAHAEFARTAEEASVLAAKQDSSLERSASSIEFLTVLAENLSDNLRDLASLRQILGSIKSTALPPEQALEALDQRYTMDAEREVHRRLLQAQAPGVVTPPENSTFPPTDSPSPNLPENKAASTDPAAKAEVPSAAATTAPEDLGDNVELF
jgi:hypothetical protein